MDSILAIQPEKKSRTLSRSFHLYRLTFFHVFFLALVFSLLTFTPSILALLTGKTLFFSGSRNFILFSLWLFLLNLMALTFFTAILWRIQSVINNVHESNLQDIKMGIRKLPRIFIAGVIEYIIFLGLIIISYGFLMLFQDYLTLNPQLTYTEIFLGLIIFSLQLFISIYIFFLFYFYLPLILTENNGIIYSLKHSASLVWKNWWRTFLVQITPGICYFIFLLLCRTGFNALTQTHLSPSSQFVIDMIIQIITCAIFVPWIASTMLVQLRDLELRKTIPPNHALALDKK